MTINFTPRDKIACHVEEFYHVNLTLLSNEKFHISNLDQFTFKIAPHDKFTMFAAFLRITLF